MDAEVRDRALKKANRVRLGRAKLKRELKAGKDPIKVLEKIPTAALGMRVEEFLIAVPQVGRKKANRMLADARVSSGRTLGALAPIQKETLAQALEEVRRERPI